MALHLGHVTGQLLSHLFLAHCTENILQYLAIDLPHPSLFFFFILQHYWSFNRFGQACPKQFKFEIVAL